MAGMYSRVAFLCALLGCGEPAAVDAGDFTFAVEAESPLVVGRNALIIEVSGADGRPVDAADVVIDTEMPAHGHGSTEAAIVADLGDGRYRAYPVTLFMPGHWIIGIHAEAGEAQGDFTLEADVR